eukprot:TRINITY_DN69526_c0_g1_i1.p1 TRINITY_DN69526_c0_g1~~TRINITY_DN69526_c0_g1_i1.p1  ORF type:complete len:225 (-),score=33.49 TRINITY_DN69526_c0_g1_i1:61-735(-)
MAFKEQPQVQSFGMKHSMVIFLMASMVPVRLGQDTGVGGLVHVASAIHQQRLSDTSDRSGRLSNSSALPAAAASGLRSDVGMPAHINLRASSATDSVGSSAVAAFLHKASSIRLRYEEGEVLSLKDALKCCMYMVFFSCIVSLIYAIYLRCTTNGAFLDGFARVIWFQAAVVAVATVALVLTSVSPAAVPWLVVLAGTALNIGIFHVHSPGNVVVVHGGAMGVK